MSDRAVLVMSDLHYGKVTPSFNPDAVSEMLGKLSKRLSRLGQERPEPSALSIFILGDVNDGTGIYATQSHYQAITNVEQQASEVAHLLSDMIVEQQESWAGGVDVHCVAGNHGRAGKFAHEAANWDLVTYRYMSLLLRERAGINVSIPRADESPFLRKVDIHGHGYLLYHGHDIRTWGSIPWYGILLRLLRWYSALPGWTVATMGHFHTLGYWRFNNLTALSTGTMVTDDEWSLRVLGWEPVSSWWLFGVDETRPVTWQMALDLRD